jgi:hypothetical protein
MQAIDTGGPLRISSTVCSKPASTKACLISCELEVEGVFRDTPRAHCAGYIGRIRPAPVFVIRLQAGPKVDEAIRSAVWHY